MRDTDIYVKTDAGREEIRARTRGLPMSVRAILLMVDGQRDVAAMRAIIGGSKAPAHVLDQLEAQGLIARLGDAPSTVDAAPPPAAAPPDVAEPERAAAPPPLDAAARPAALPVDAPARPTAPPVEAPARPSAPRPVEASPRTPAVSAPAASAPALFVPSALAASTPAVSAPTPPLRQPAPAPTPRPAPVAETRPAPGASRDDELDLRLATIPVPEPADAPALDRYDHLYSMMNDIVRDFLSPTRRYFFQLKIERASTSEELMELLHDLQAVLAKSRGDAFASEVIARLRNAAT